MKRPELGCSSRFLVFVILAILQEGSAKSNPGLQVQTKSDGHYQVLVGGDSWLSSDATFLHAQGKEHSTEDGSMYLSTPPQATEGQDSYGIYTKEYMTYNFKDSSIAANTWQLSIKSYAEQPFVVFEQYFPNAFNETSTGNKDAVVSGFPSFKVDGDGSLGLLAYSGTFFWQNDKAQRWKFNMSHIPDGTDGGVLALYDQEGSVLVMTAFNNFMAASVSHNTARNSLSWGIMGGVGAVPEGYVMRTILYYSNQGFNRAMEEWGRLMQREYGKDRSSARRDDPTINYLGYYTDNGAYYYNVTEPNMNYEETLLAVYKQAQLLDIPYRYIQYDDWWYYVTPDGYGMALTWDARASVFPHGMQYIYNITRLPVLAHNRMWSSLTPYAKQNGGKYEFLKSANKDMSLPLEQVFWDDLFSKAVQWGLAVYEQDFLSTQFDQIPELHQDLFLGRQWLLQMGEAASRLGLRIQYCMALPRYVLQSLEIPVVTQIRASEDYINPNQWRIGVSSILAHAVGLAPWKDNFWTESIQPGNKYKRTEPYPVLQAVVSLLSTGPVGPSDRLGYTNDTLQRSVAMSDGLLLKPSKPATAIDAQIMQLTFGGSAGVQGQVYTTFSEISGFFFGIILAAEIKNNYTLYPSDAGFIDPFPDSAIYRYSSNAMPIKELDRFRKSTPLLLDTNCTATDFCLYYTAPVWVWGPGSGSEVAILGELDKIVPMSSERVKEIQVDEHDIVLTLAGVEGENVPFYFSMDEAVLSVTCSFQAQRKARISLAAQRCDATN